MHDSTKRRVDVLTKQLLPSRLREYSEVSASSSGCQPNLDTHATSATGQQRDVSSYAKVHGEVSRGPANWTNIPSVQQQKLEEVLYHKALDEGIAKVCNLPVYLCTSAARNACICIPEAIHSHSSLMRCLIADHNQSAT